MVLGGNHTAAVSNSD